MVAETVFVSRVIAASKICLMWGVIVTFAIAMQQFRG